MKYLYKIWGGWAAYGFVRGMRSEYEDKMISTRMMSSIGNGIYYGACPVMPAINLIDRIQIHFQPLEPSKYQKSYQELVGVNWNVIL
jgi:hypothetical protein